METPEQQTSEAVERAVGVQGRVLPPGLGEALRPYAERMLRKNEDEPDGDIARTALALCAEWDGWDYEEVIQHLDAATEHVAWLRRHLHCTPHYCLHDPAWS